MKIISYKKTSRGRYIITLDNNKLTLYEDVILNNNLLFQKDITLELLEKVMNENNYYEAYDLSLSYIETKLRTESEIISYLEKKGFTKNIIDDTIKKLKESNLINEKLYIEAYTNDKINLSSYGPFKIKRNLLDLGLSEEEIDAYLVTISSEVWKSKLDKIISKKVSLMKNKSAYMIKNKLKVDLFNLGYDRNMIDSLLISINLNDEDAIKKEMSKAYDKYSKKYEGEQLKRQIKNHLYKKGFSLTKIEKLINKY